MVSENRVSCESLTYYIHCVTLPPAARGMLVDGSRKVTPLRYSFVCRSSITDGDSCCQSVLWNIVAYIQRQGPKTSSIASCVISMACVNSSRVMLSGGLK